MHITTKVVTSNAVNGEVYSIQHYVIKFVSYLPQVGDFFHQYNWPPGYNWNTITLKKVNYQCDVSKQVIHKKKCRIGSEEWNDLKWRPVIICRVRCCKITIYKKNLFIIVGGPLVVTSFLLYDSIMYCL